MNALARLSKPKPPPTMPAATPDYDDMADMPRELYLELRERHREALGRRFSGTTRAQTPGGGPRKPGRKGALDS